ncbi:MAG: RsmE family RNA methyltransferase [Bacteroidales bacterium]|nr:RsmE family RNA methyltransferase [Bacteroidales bacterium]MDY6002332.1 RsmE family RNA methyltransferase [Candidatus Cryptobacteroides sp.]
MEIFYTDMVDGREAKLDSEESTHAVKVLRHRRGDEITVVDGLGNMFHCRLTDDSPKGAVAEILEKVPGWGAHPYSLNMAVCPTKNIDRLEWFCEKATELGVDAITPIIGERSERRVFKPERCKKIVLSAMKQSLKAQLPTVFDAVPLKDFLSQDVPGLKLICYCFEGNARRKSITDVLNEYATKTTGIGTANHCPETPDEPKITILIGPEGDFSPEEANLAVSRGYIPVHLGQSRLRTETAALTAVTATYLHFIHY